MSKPPPTIETAIKLKVLRLAADGNAALTGFALHDVVDVVMILHRAVDDGSGELTVCAKCCGPSESWERIAQPWPCDTVKVVARALGLKEGDWR